MAVQRMYPTSHACSWTRGTGYGTHTAAGTSTDSLSGDCYSYCDDLDAALDETGYAVARSSATAGQVNHGRFEWYFGDPPQNVTISSATLVVWCRTSNAGPAIIDSTPTIKLFVNDGGGGGRQYQAGTQSVTAAANRNTETAPGTCQKITYTWTTDPGTGTSWVRSNLLAGSFLAGLESDGTAGRGTGIDATTGGSSASFDVASVYVELVTTPSALYVEPVRLNLSHLLRILRKPLRTVTIDVPVEFADVEPGDTVWASHALLPGSLGTDAWTQVPLFVTGVADRLDPPAITLTAYDLRQVYASFWSPFQITGMDALNSGLALLHRGGGWSTVRNQIAFGQRPGDGLYVSVAVNSPLLTKDGLIIQGGSDVNYLTYSTFSAGSFTGWGSTVTGGATLTADTADYLIDVAGYQQSCKATTTAAGENCYVSQTVAGFAANTKLFVRCWYKNDSGSDPFFVKITRSVDGWSWNDSAGAWQAAAAYYYPTKSSTIARGCTKQIDVGAAGTNVSVFMGFLNGLSTTANTGHIYAVELQLGTTFSWCRRDLLPTTAAAVTRVADKATIDNSASFRVFSPSRGCFALDFAPQWSHSDFADGQGVGILGYAMNGPADPSGIGLFYSRIDATSGYWSWYGAVVNTSGATLPAAGTTYRLAGRLNSEANDEWGITGQSSDLWVDGVKGTTFGPNAEKTPLSTACIQLGHVSLDVPPITYLYADGTLSNLLIDSRCPSDADMARL